MIRLLSHAFVVPALVCASTPASAAPAEPRMSVEDQAAVRCSAAFALVAGEQGRGAETGLPSLGQRGREYMVRTGARLLDKGWSEAQVTAAMQTAARDLDDRGTVMQVAAPCMALLDAEVAPLITPDVPQCVAIMRARHEAAHGDSAAARYLLIAERLEAGIRQEAAAQGQGREEVDAILAAEAAITTQVAAQPGGLERFDLSACERIAGQAE